MPKRWTHEIICRRCKRPVISPYRDWCYACYENRRRHPTLLTRIKKMLG